jgi:SAM-dependent methyltransferase
MNLQPENATKRSVALSSKDFFIQDDGFIAENRTYWTQRSSSYSAQHQGQLASQQRYRWARELTGAIRSAFPDTAPHELSVLDVGCGPGFMGIVLALAGFDVTSIDYTPAMLDQARANALEHHAHVDFLQMDVERLEFPDEWFDVVVSRNVTWNLPHPCRAYEQWARVLRRGGLLLNYDANWYGYLYQDSFVDDLEFDREHVGRAAIGDKTVHTDIDTMERLAREVPLSHLSRPLWDVRLLARLGLSAESDLDVYRHVWSDVELVTHSRTPLFRVMARK